MAWFETYERDVNGAPGAPWPTRPRPVPHPELLATIEETTAAEVLTRTSLLGLLFAGVRAAVAVVRR